MSKIPAEKMKFCIQQMLQNHKSRKFVETVDLQIGLKDYDPVKDKRFAGSVRLPYIPRPKLKVKIKFLTKINFRYASSPMPHKLTNVKNTELTALMLRP
jgi:ribosomal protein L1